MGFFDDMNNKSAINSRINKAKALINTNYTELGTRYYNLYKDNPDPKFSQLIDEIKAAYDEIKKAEVELALLRGVVFCPNCNSECPVNLNYCTKCGNKLIKPEPKVGAAPVQPTVAPEPVVETPVATEEPVVKTEEPIASKAVIDPAFKFCTDCGQKVSSQAMFCTNCGKPFN